MKFMVSRVAALAVFSASVALAQNPFDVIKTVVTAPFTPPQQTARELTSEAAKGPAVAVQQAQQVAEHPETALKPFNNPPPELQTLAAAVSNGADHLGVEIDNKITQPVIGGLTHAAQQLDFVGRAKDTLADGNSMVEARVREIEQYLNGLLVTIFAGIGGLMILARLLRRPSHAK